MKKVYYLGHCGSGRSVHYRLIDLVKEEGNKLLFHIDDFDWDTNKERIITLRAKRVIRKDFYGKDYEMIDFHSSKEQYKFHFIREMEIEDSVEPEKWFITND
jgi:hypothetical protein